MMKTVFYLTSRFKAPLPCVVSVFLVLALMQVCLTNVIHAQQEIPNGAKSTIEKKPPGEWRAYAGEYGRIKTVKTDIKHVPEALQITTSQKPDSEFKVQLIFPASDQISKQDTLLISFKARAIDTSDESGAAKLLVFFQRSKKPWTKSIFKTATLNDQWTTYYYPFKAHADFKHGEASLNFAFGFLPQVVEITDVKLLNYRNLLKVQDLPETRAKISYAGMAPNAPWRDAAVKRIKKYRQSPLKITLKDAAGNPIQNAQIEVRQQRHAYHFGSAVTAQLLQDQSEIGEQYRQIVKDHYNMVVFENDLKHGPWIQGTRTQPGAFFNREDLLNALKWLKENQIKVRGHTLLWGPVRRDGFYHMFDFENNKISARKNILDQINEKLSITQPYIKQWDALNHPVARFGDQGKRLDTVYGFQIYTQIMNHIKQKHPKLELYVNEGNVIAGGRVFDTYHRFIQRLIKENTKPDGIGFMCHFNEADLTGMPSLYNMLESFAEFGLPLMATELDITTKDEEGQAAYLRDFMTMWFSHPKTNGIILWGFWEGRHWRPDAALYRRDFSEKPAAIAWKNLVFNQWWTNTTLKSNQNGEAITAAFHGEYKIIITTPLKKKAVNNIHHDKQGSDLQIILK